VLHLTLYHHCLRLHTELAGARLRGVHGNSEVVELELVAAGSARGRLRIDLRDDPTLLWLTDATLPPPADSATPLIRHLTHRLRGARLSEIACCSRDRIVHLGFARRRLSGRGETIDLIAELFGRPPRLLALGDDGRIAALSSPRPVDRRDLPPLLAGAPYLPPQPPPDRNLAAPLTPSPGRLFEEEARQRPATELAAALARGEAWAYRHGHSPWRAAPLRLTQPGLEEAGPFSDLTAALRHGHTAPHAGGDGAPLRRRLTRALARARKRLTRAVAANKRALAGCDEEGLWRRRGEAILCELAHLPAGREGWLEADDLPDSMRRVAPDSRPTAQAEAAFHRARRLARTRDGAAARLQALSHEAAYLDELAVAVEQAGDGPLLEALAEEMAEARYLPRRKERRSRRRGATPGVRTFEVAGWRLSVGRHGRANAALVRRARPDDFWLHALHHPGAHVVIANPERRAAPPEEVLAAAAGLAAHFSRGRNEARVACYATQIRYLRRGPGMAPGQVLVDRYREAVGDPEAGARAAGEAGEKPVA